jgi:hypothetical protein
LGVRLTVPGKCAAGELTFSGEVLARLDGRPAVPVHFEAISTQEALARWDEAGAPRTLAIDLVDLAGLPPWPASTGTPRDVPPEFLAALAEAAKTTAKDAARFALTRVQLRGRDGQVVGTDGRQLLAWGGFHLPFPDELLVPRVPAFGLKEVQATSAVRVGRAGDHVLVEAGPWAFALEVDRAGRFPDVTTVLGPARAPKCRWSFAAATAALDEALERLPGADAEHAPVTLDLAGTPTLRAAPEGGPEGGPPVEVALPGPAPVGPPVRVALDRRYLARALRLGLTAVGVSGPEQPVVFRDRQRTYLVMPLDPGSAVGPMADARKEPVSMPSSLPEPTPESDPEEPPMAPPANLQPASAFPPAAEPQDALAAAEAARALVHEAACRLGQLVALLKRQRRQQNALASAMTSLRQLQRFDFAVAPEPRTPVKEPR